MDADVDVACNAARLCGNGLHSARIERPDKQRRGLLGDRNLHGDDDKRLCKWFLSNDCSCDRNELCNPVNLVCRHAIDLGGARQAVWATFG